MSGYFYDDPWPDDDDDDGSFNTKYWSNWTYPDRVARDDRDIRQVVESGAPVWVDGYGNRKPISSMTTSHIINCIRLCNRRHEELASIVSKFGRQENVVLQRQIDNYVESITQFFRELERRGERVSE